jgi:hypothetical protein
MRFTKKSLPPLVAGALALFSGTLLLVAIACGGSGGGSSPAPTLAAPTITTQPQSQTVTAPATATFTVVATGNPAPTYQWSLNGTAIANATGASFTTAASTTAMDGGSYTVTATNSQGSITSSAATLTVQTGGQYVVYLISPATGYDMVKAFGISDTGVIAGYAHATGGLNQAALWTGGPGVYALQNLSASGGIVGAVYAISGSEAVGSCERAILWTGTTAATAVDLPSSGAYGYADVAFGLSGNIIVGRSGGQHAVLWTGPSWSLTDLHPSGYLNSEATGAAGDHVVGSGLDSGGSSHALLWTGTSSPVVHDLHPTGFISSQALAVSGSTVVGGAYSGTANHAAKWTGTSGTTFVDLHDPTYGGSTAYGIAGSSAVGVGITTGNTNHALLWAEGIVDLHTYLSGTAVTITSSEARGINSRGDIVGNGTDSNGKPYIIVWFRNIS